MTAYGTTQTAIQAMKHGAFDYVLKPFDLKKLKEMVAKALKASVDADSSESVTKRLLNQEDFEEGIVGSGEKMQQVLKQVGQVAASEATVMITGESGTGRNWWLAVSIDTATAQAAHFMRSIVVPYRKT